MLIKERQRERERKAECDYKWERDKKAHIAYNRERERERERRKTQSIYKREKDLVLKRERRTVFIREREWKTDNVCVLDRVRDGIQRVFCWVWQIQPEQKRFLKKYFLPDGFEHCLPSKNFAELKICLSESFKIENFLKNLMWPLSQRIFLPF